MAAALGAVAADAVPSFRCHLNRNEKRAWIFGPGSLFFLPTKVGVTATHYSFVGGCVAFSFGAFSAAGFIACCEEAAVFDCGLKLVGRLVELSGCETTTSAGLP